MEDFRMSATEKMAHIEESLKSAHKRIDQIDTWAKSVYELASSIKTMKDDHRGKTCKAVGLGCYNSTYYHCRYCYRLLLPNVRGN